MNSRLDMKNYSYAVEALEPKVMERLATMIELSPEDIMVLNNLIEGLALGVNDEV